MTSANTMQVGGKHYAKGGDLQHWDLVELAQAGYLEGYATKYLMRWRQKNGVEDLQKARHTVVKLIELHDAGVRNPRGGAQPEQFKVFFERHPHLGPHERSFITLLLSAWTVTDLHAALTDIDALTEEVNGKPDQSPAS